MYIDNSTAFKILTIYFHIQFHQAVLHDTKVKIIRYHLLKIKFLSINQITLFFKLLYLLNSLTVFGSLACRKDPINSPPLVS